MPHDAFVDLLGLEPRSAQSFAHHQGTQLHSRKCGECSLKFSNRCAHSGDNDYIFHNVAALNSWIPKQRKPYQERAIAGKEGGTNMESTPSTQLTSGPDDQPRTLLAPWWHTALMVVLILALSLAGARQLRSRADHPLHLVANYSLSIAYEWILAALALWGISLRKVPLRQLLGVWEPGSRAWLRDIGTAFAYWVVALMVLAALGNGLAKFSGSHIDPQKIGDVDPEARTHYWR